ncbi:MAG TPA: branched-chain amino acid ABC transporter permease [Clostridiales bacterium]|nr:branched-chain amino acid ABC transporter permease [Clostridiales bacterium]
MKNTKKISRTSAAVYIILTLFFLLAPIFFKSRTWLNSFVMIFVSVVGTTSLRTIALSGNMSFAHSAFIGVGAYTAGILGKELGLSIFLSIPLGALAAMLLGLITGWPFARLRSIYFCMGSMFMGVAIIQFISAMKITGGAIGLQKIPSMSKALTGLFKGEVASAFLDKLGLGGVQLSYYFFLLITLLCMVILYRFEHSRIGWTLRALSQSPEVAASIGINERFYRQMSVGIGTFCAGIIGATYAHYSTTLSPNGYSMGNTLWLIMYMMIGGQGNFIGPIIGAILLELINQIPSLLTAMSGRPGVSVEFIAFSRFVGRYSAYTPFLTAVALLIVAYIFPGGLVSIPSLIRESSKRRKERKAVVLAEGGEDDAA